MTPNITAITTELITAIRILMSRDFGAVPAYNTLNRNTKNDAGDSKADHIQTGNVADEQDQSAEQLYIVTVILEEFTGLFKKAARPLSPGPCPL